MAEDWADWFDLVGAFVAAYVPDEVGELEEAATFMDGPEVGPDARSLTRTGPT